MKQKRDSICVIPTINLFISKKLKTENLSLLKFYQQRTLKMKIHTFAFEIIITSVIASILLLSCNNGSNNSETTKGQTYPVKNATVINDSIKSDKININDSTLMYPQEVQYFADGGQPDFDYYRGKMLIAVNGENSKGKFLCMKFQGKKMNFKFNNKLSNSTTGIFESNDYKVKILLSKPYIEDEGINPSEHDHKMVVFYNNDSLTFLIKANDEQPWSSYFK